MKKVAVLMCLLLLGCSEEQAVDADPTGSARKLSVYTVNYPLAWAAEELAGDLAEVHFPAPADVDPAFWEPSVENLVAYQQADLIVLNGAGYARWPARFSLPENTMLDTSRKFSDQLIRIDGGPVHSHGPGGEHSHGELAFTVWLDLQLFARQVRAIGAALQSLLPQSAGEIEQRVALLQREVARLDGELATLGEALAGAPLLYSHPVYQYLDRRYQLNGRALHWEPGQVLSPSDLADLDRILAEHPARLMLWEDEPLPEIRALLARRGVSVVVFRPLGNRPVVGDFLDGMGDNAAALEAGLPQASSQP